MGCLVYGYWDCSQCGSKGICGDIRDCPNCGRPRSSDTKFYMGQNVKYVPAEKAKNISKNPDWLCPYCNSLNSDTDTVCKGCGASKSESEADYFDLQSNELPADWAERKQKNTEISDSHDSNSDALKTNVKKWFTKDNVLKIAFSSIVVVLLSVICIFLFNCHEEEMTVTAFSWKRSIEIEELVTVNESGWSLPYNARLISTSTEFKEYTQVLDHYETKNRQVAKQRIVGYETYVSGYRDLGNGMFEEITAQKPIYETYYDTETYQDPVYRQEPVYATKYYYELDKWIYSRSVNTGGTDKDPIWGDYQLCEKERVGTEKEIYMVYLISEDKESYTYNISYSDWDELSAGDTVIAKVNLLGTVMSVKFPSGELKNKESVINDN